VRPVFYGWWIVLACSAITSYAAGILYYGFTAFFTPLIQEFGWSRASTSLAFSLYRLEGGLAAPVVGYLIDRLGPRKMMTTAVALLGLGFILLSRINSLGTFYAVFIFIAFSNSLGFLPVGNFAVANWFIRKRGIALGLLSGGISLCGFLVPVLTWIILTWGWRTAAVAAGIGMWVIGLPLCMVLRNRPEPYGLLPDGEKPEFESPNSDLEPHIPVPTKSVVRSGSDGGEYTIKEAVHTRCFWNYSLAMVLPYMATAALFVHEIPFLLKTGIPVETAALVVTGTVLLSGVGRVGFGWMSDRFTKRRLMAIAMASQCVGMLIFANIHALWHVVPFMALFGIGYGGMNPLRAAIQGEYFGTIAFGTIQGILLGTWAVGTMLGPVLAGWFFDVTGDYRKVFLIFGLAVMAIAIPLILLCRPPAPKRQSS